MNVLQSIYPLIPIDKHLSYFLFFFGHSVALNIFYYNSLFKYKSFFTLHT